jgi:CDP-glucose 4,6-dehydratase
LTPRSTLRGFGGIYQGRRVLVTGHTGFKGSWLALWLRELGADVHGFSLEATKPNHWESLDLAIAGTTGDIRDRRSLTEFVARTRPEIVFHLAAQPLVRLSYEQPLETYATNVMGSLHLYEACRLAGTVRAIVSITTDKVYENREWVWGYRESDPLGGHDPYSSSKACADLASTSYARSFWPIDGYGSRHRTLLATARAGNVIGGGDWARDRLVPDVVRAAAAERETILRNPRSTRPWQHVLEPLAGYLLLGQRLFAGDTSAARGWNFGPSESGVRTVEEVVVALQNHWPKIRYRVELGSGAHEAKLLMLDCAQARSALGWRPIWDGEPGLSHAIEWYRAYYEYGRVASRDQLARYVRDAREAGLGWTKGEP